MFWSLLSPDSLSFAVTEVAQWHRECITSVSLLSFTILYRTSLPSISMSLPTATFHYRDFTHIYILSLFSQHAVLMSRLHTSASLRYILVQVNQSSSSLIRIFLSRETMNRTHWHHALTHRHIWLCKNTQTYTERPHTEIWHDFECSVLYSFECCDVA